AHHDWWRYIEPSHPAYTLQDAERYGHLVPQIYQVADECVGRFLDAIDDDTMVIIMSDHGGGAHPAYYFNTNRWLRTLELLHPHAKASKGTGKLNDAFKRVYRTRIRPFPSLEKVYRRLPQRLKRMATELDSQAMMNLDAVDWKRTKAYRFPMYPPVEG